MLSFIYYFCRTNLGAENYAAGLEGEVLAVHVRERQYLRMVIEGDHVTHMFFLIPKIILLSIKIYVFLECHSKFAYNE